MGAFPYEVVNACLHFLLEICHKHLNKNLDLTKIILNTPAGYCVGYTMVWCVMVYSLQHEAKLQSVHDCVILERRDQTKSLCFHFQRVLFQCLSFMSHSGGTRHPGGREGVHGAHAVEGERGC